jgi:hypothetical protein
METLALQTRSLIVGFDVKDGPIRHCSFSPDPVIDFLQDHQYLGFRKPGVNF